ncbi:YrhB domain-containing protein [Massilia sp. CF038]|uniref:YrhB domain-containing protein n=1 Tax=Massilia sp. CF038 TaxID=1881045 RepID=UPI00092171AB|nr:YrhB domain-containing protein [Massilia sp. CF038]SHG63571.1 hypothetical protein SAMN05428948_1379 [Massilia sp. CF038]
MLIEVECRAFAEQYLLRLAQECGEELVLMPSSFETSATFAFFYNTKEFLATGNYIYALAGNAPLMVSKLTGEMKVAGTALPIEDYVREFEAMRGRSALGASGLCSMMAAHGQNHMDQLGV